MTHPYADWQVAELSRLSQVEPDRIERVLNALWSAVPGLYEELAASAGVECAREDITGFALVETGSTSVARLSESRIAVWEVVRVYRRVGTIDALQEAFPSVELHELRAAIEYGDCNCGEIDGLIERYELMLQQRREQYPYTR